MTEHVHGRTVGENRLKQLQVLVRFVEYCYGQWRSGITGTLAGFSPGKTWNGYG
ncbi:MAG: hypothetical protein AB7G75_13430 [Candidatus Binatia bacterium]